MNVVTSRVGLSDLHPAASLARNLEPGRSYPLETAFASASATREPHAFQSVPDFFEWGAGESYTVGPTPAERLRRLHKTALAGGANPLPARGASLLHHIAKSGEARSSIAHMLDRTLPHWPVHTAAERHREIKRSLSNGSTVPSTLPQLTTPPMRARQQISLNVQDANGRTPLHFAVLPKATTPLPQLPSAKPNYRGTKVLDPLVGLLQQQSGSEIRKSRAALNPNVKDINERTPLHYAALNGNVKAVRQLLLRPQFQGRTTAEIGLRIPYELQLDPVDRNGVTPLHLAAYSKSIPTLRAMLNALQSAVGASGTAPHLHTTLPTIERAIHATDGQGNSVLSYAVAADEPQAVTLLARYAGISVPRDTAALAAEVGNQEILAQFKNGNLGRSASV